MPTMSNAATAPLSAQVDEASLFYMMARGIPRAEAEALLVRAFLMEAVETIGDEAIAEALGRRCLVLA